MDKVIRFLQDLAANNNRDWFDANKERYIESRNKVLFMTDVLIHEIKKFDPEIPQMDPKKCMLRIFRDVRFSNDKRPYKTNFGSFIADGGRKSQLAGYYFHIEPDGSFLGGGVYMPEAEQLKAIRNYISRFPEEFLEIINEPEFKAIYPEMYDHKLKTSPKGFPKDHPHIDLLRFKSFIFSTPVSNDILSKGDFINHSVRAFKELHKVNSYLNDAIRNLS